MQTHCLLEGGNCWNINIPDVLATRRLQVTILFFVDIFSPDARRVLRTPRDERLGITSTFNLLFNWVVRNLSQRRGSGNKFIYLPSLDQPLGASPSYLFKSSILFSDEFHNSAAKLFGLYLWGEFNSLPLIHLFRFASFGPRGTTQKFVTLGLISGPRCDLFPRWVRR